MVGNAGWVNWEGVSSDKLDAPVLLRVQEAFCYWVGLTNMETKLAVGLFYGDVAKW